MELDLDTRDKVEFLHNPVASVKDTPRKPRKPDQRCEFTAVAFPRKSPILNHDHVLAPYFACALLRPVRNFCRERFVSRANVGVLPRFEFSRGPPPKGGRGA